MALVPEHVRRVPFRPSPRCVVKGLAPDDPAIIASRLLLLGGVLRRGIEDACIARPVADVSAAARARNQGVLNDVTTIQDPPTIDADRVRLLLLFLEQVNARDTLTVGRIALLMGCSPATASRATRRAWEDGILMVPRNRRGYQLSQFGQRQLESIIDFVRKVATAEIGREAIVEDAASMKSALWCGTVTRFGPNQRNARLRALKSVA